MNKIHSFEVNELRRRTGAKLMDCKNALIDVDDRAEATLHTDDPSEQKFDEDLFSKAETWLKKKNLTTRGTPDSKPTNSRVAIVSEGGRSAIAQVLCETDFLSKSPIFDGLTIQVAELALSKDYSGSDFEVVDPKEIDTLLSEVLSSVSSQSGENIEIGKVLVFPSSFGAYVHHDNKKAAIINGSGSQEVLKEVAMHVVFSSPKYAFRKDVPVEIVEKEKALILATISEEQKNGKQLSEEILHRKTDGQLNKFFSSIVLEDQPFFKEQKVKVKDFCSKNGVTVHSFHQFS